MTADNASHAAGGLGDDFTPTIPPPDPNTRTPNFKMPRGACDAHCHVFGPASRYPYAPDRTYTPPDAPLEAFRKLMSGEPRILYYEDEEGGTFQTRCMRDGDEMLAAKRLREFFQQEARKG